MSDLILNVVPLGFPWATVDPFLFCMHHLDAYPAGDERMAPPAASLAGRALGQDFAGKDGWRMYHGETVPGFPHHPHRGFETVTIVRRGRIDHADSLGAAARFGDGDAQWLTAGAGIVHSEMFPLLHRERPNPLELFQIWLNLPSADKLAPPHFAMLWRESIPRVRVADAQGRIAELTVIAGTYQDQRAPSPPPRSWAARPDSDVAIWTIDLEPGATVTLPPAASAKSTRTLYFFRGDSLRVGDHLQRGPAAIAVRSDREVRLEAGDEHCEILMLQGRPIAELTVVAGTYEDQRAPSPPPRSWAARPDSDVAIWTIDLEPGATVTLPPAASAKSTRTLYFFRGDSLRVGDHLQRSPAAIAVRSDREVRLEAGDEHCEILMLQGRPIAEPVAQHGPFVMNTRAELQRAFADYQETQFGGWPWPSDGPVHARDEDRFARHADGRIERVTSEAAANAEE